MFKNIYFNRKLCLENPLDTKFPASKSPKMGFRCPDFHQYSTFGSYF
jgi:hypothetical protein